MAVAYNYRDAFKGPVEKVYDSQYKPTALNRKSNADDIIRYKQEFNEYAARKYANPFYGVTNSYLNSIKAYSDIDDNFGFDGRYFHLGNNPSPIDKIQTAAINGRLKVVMAETESPNEFYGTKYHIIATKFLHSLNRANRYLKSIMELEKKSNKQYRINDPNDASMKKFKQEQDKVIAWFTQPRVELPGDTIDKINLGLKDNSNLREKLIPPNKDSVYATIGRNVREDRDANELDRAKRFGFKDRAQRKEAMKEYSKQVKLSKMKWAWGMDLVGYNQITHSGNLIGYGKEYRDSINLGVKPQIKWGNNTPIIKEGTKTVTKSIPKLQQPTTLTQEQLVQMQKILGTKSPTQVQPLIISTGMTEE